MAALVPICVLAALVALALCARDAAMALETDVQTPELLASPAPADAAPSAELQQVLDDVVPCVEEPALPADLEYDPHVVLVVVDEGSDGRDVSQALAEQGVDSIVPGSVTMLSNSVAQVRVAPGATVGQAIAELSASGAVDAACPDVILHVADDASVEPMTSADAAEPQGQTQGNEPAGEVLSMEAEADAGQGTEAVAASTPTDPTSDQAPTALLPQAGADTDDPFAPYQWAHESMRVPQALALANQAGAADRSVGVAIIDSAFQADHPDLLSNQAVVYDAYNKVENPQPVEGDQGETTHGMHVAGIVGAEANNGMGVAGVAGNKARILLLRVSSSTGSIKTSTVVNAYAYVQSHKDEYNVRVVNLSLGQVWPENYNQAILNTIESAYRNDGIVTVGAAGNSNLGKVPFRCYPSDFYAVVSVANLTTSFSTKANTHESIVQKGNTSRQASYLYNASDVGDVRLASDSNYNQPGSEPGGEGVNIAAPGSNVLSLLATVGGDGVYGYNSGTSMAAPQVAGVLSLMFATNPDLSADDARNALFSSARDIGDEGWDERFGYGAVDALGAVEAAAGGVAQGPGFLGVDQTARYVVPTFAGQSHATSSNPDVLEVDADGTARALKAGMATVTISGNGLSSAREVCVVGPLYGDAYVAVGGSTKLGVVQPQAAGTLGWKWESSDKTVATVTSDGVVYGHAAGRVAITATLVADPSVSFATQMRVYQPLLAEGSLAAGYVAQLVLGDDVPQEGLLSSAWASGDEGIATVDADGRVKGVAAGTTTLTWTGTYEPTGVPAAEGDATAEGAATAEASSGTVTLVYPLRVYGPLEGTDTMFAGATTALRVRGVEGDLARGWTWTSAKPSVATVKDGVVSGLSVGTATVRATRGDVSFAMTVRVKALTKVPVPAAVSYAYTGRERACGLAGTGYALSGTLRAKDAGTYTVVAALREGYAWSDGSRANKRVNWTIAKARLTATYVGQKITAGNEAAATVRVTGFVGPDDASNAAGYKAPTVAITAAQRNKPGTYAIKPAGGAAKNYAFAYVAGTLTVVAKPPVAVTGVTLSAKSLALRPEQTKALTARVQPANAADKTVRWKSSNAKVAKVSATGKVTAVSVGSATITATAGGKAASCKVTVALPAAHVAYGGHVQGLGWLANVCDGRTAGTTGQSRRLEAVRIGLQGAPYAGAIEYRCHVQGVGWQGWVRDGAVGGLTGKSRRLEAVRVRLTGAMARHYDVSYRTHVQGIGWTPWVRNGATAGTTGQSRRIEAIQVRVLPK